MIPSSLELNSDDFPFFGDLKRTSGSQEKLEKSSFENRDNHHWPGGSEMSRWWWWWWLEKIRKTKIQKKDRNTNTKTNTKTDTHTQIQKNTKYTITKRSECKKSNVMLPCWFFSFFTSDYLIVCNYSNTSEVEISCRTYNSGAVNYHFLLPLNLSF